MSKLDGWFALVGTLLVVCGFIYIEINIDQAIVGEFLDQGKLTPAQEKSLDIMLGLVDKIINWSLGIIAGVGFLIKAEFEKQIELKRIDLLFAFLVLILSVSSIYFGHLVIDMSAIVLSNKIFPVNIAEIKQFAGIQYVLGLSALGFFGFQLFRFMLQSRKED